MIRVRPQKLGLPTAFLVAPIVLQSWEIEKSWATAITREPR